MQYFDGTYWVNANPQWGICVYRNLVPEEAIAQALTRPDHTPVSATPVCVCGSLIDAIYYKTELTNEHRRRIENGQGGDWPDQETAFLRSLGYKAHSD